MYTFLSYSKLHFAVIFSEQTKKLEAKNETFSATILIYLTVDYTWQPDWFLSSHEPALSSVGVSSFNIARNKTYIHLRSKEFLIIIIDALKNIFCEFHADKFVLKMRFIK